MIAIQIISLVAFSAVHVFAGKLRFLDVLPRSRWLSAASGISVSYIFLHVFPELAEAQETIGGSIRFLPWIEHHAYLVALGGLALFYGLEKMAKAGDSQDQGKATSGIFWLHISSFALYNALIGYLLIHREEDDLRGLVFYAVAMTLHFLVNDFGLRKHHRESYDRIARWVLAVAIAAGWVVGWFTSINAAALDSLFAFLAGGVILNVLKEELPDERKSRFLPFACGAVGYSLLLVLL